MSFDDDYDDYFDQSNFQYGQQQFQQGQQQFQNGQSHHLNEQHKAVQMNNGFDQSQGKGFDQTEANPLSNLFSKKRPDTPQYIYVTVGQFAIKPADLPKFQKLLHPGSIPLVDGSYIHNPQVQTQNVYFDKNTKKYYIEN